jgi:hypothetical protein
MAKITHEPLTWDILSRRFEISRKKGFTQKQKWIVFSELLLSKGFSLTLYEARQTVSKYITVTKPGSTKTFKVRFSNHMPGKSRVYNTDCDLFVGRSQRGVITTEFALKVVLNHFK